MQNESSEYRPIFEADAPATAGGRRSFQTTSGEAGGRRGALAPLAVDAALADETAPIVAQRGSRRDLIGAGTPQDKSKLKFDVPHVCAGAEAVSSTKSALLASLSEQLNMLQVQQEQIRRLLDQAERSSGSHGMLRS